MSPEERASKRVRTIPEPKPAISTGAAASSSDHMPGSSSAGPSPAHRPSASSAPPRSGLRTERPASRFHVESQPPTQPAPQSQTQPPLALAPAPQVAHPAHSLTESFQVSNAGANYQLQPPPPPQPQTKPAAQPHRTPPQPQSQPRRTPPPSQPADRAARGGAAGAAGALGAAAAAHGAGAGGAGGAAAGAGAGAGAAAPAPPKLASAAVAVLTTALPVWAEEALRGVDPFWEPTEVLATIVTKESAPAPGTHGQMQLASALFTVGPATLTAIQNKQAQARLVCVQPGDGPPPRCHFYGGASLLLNGQQMEATREDRVALLLGPNQADQAVDVSAALRSGSNRVSLLWPVGVAGAVAALRLCRRLGPEQLAARMAPPLPRHQALAAVRAHLAAPSDLDAGAADGGAADGGGDGGVDGAAADGAGEDQGGDGERRKGGGAASAAQLGGQAQGHQSEGRGGGGGGEGGGLTATVSLRCPLGGCLATAPAHFGASATAAPLAFFDARCFLQQAAASGSWLCPATGKLGSPQDLRPHAFFSAVLATLEANGAAGRVEAVEVAPCGSWRPKDSRVPLLPVPPEGEAWPRFDVRLLDPEGGEEGRDVVDLTDD